MKLFQGIDNIEMTEETVCAVGKFDGDHIGHRILISVMNDIKADRGLKLCLFVVLNNGEKLLSDERRRRELEANGVDYIIEAGLDEIRDIGAEEFVSDVLVGMCNMRAIAAGDDCRFGKGAKGDSDLLYEMSGDYGFTVHIIEKVREETGREISSTYIRELLNAGDKEKAARLSGGSLDNLM